jgi:hypothetical protein
MAYHNGPKIITEGLVFYLDAGNTRSYPGSGTIWSSLINGEVSGSFVNDPTFNSANLGSIVFDGVNDYVNCGSNTITSFPTDFTVHTWVYPTSAPAASSFIVSRRSAATFVNNYQVFLNPSLLIVLQINNNAGGAVQVFSGSAPLNKWTCVTAVKSGSNMLVYDDTVLVASGSAPGGTITDTNAPLRIGQNHDLNAPFVGRISNVMLYNRALSQEEILRNFNAHRSRFGV